MKIRALKFLYYFINNKGLKSFLLRYSDSDLSTNILDIGCGNDSAIQIKKFLPKAHYTGVDIQKYNCSDMNNKLIDKMVIANSKNFHIKIAKLEPKYDLVISSHNLEHCLYRYSVLKSISKVIKPGGKLYLSFPCEKSINYPLRKGTLNYFTDKTHREMPPDFATVKKILKQNNIEIIFATQSYKPLVKFLIGFLLEPLSIITGRVFPSTWAYWGFETIIHGKKF